MCEDEAGPYQAIAQEVQSWQPEGSPERRSHEYIRQGTAKLLTVFEPKTGYLVAKGVTGTKNEVLHPFILKAVESVVGGIKAQVINQLQEKDQPLTKQPTKQVSRVQGKKQITSKQPKNKLDVSQANRAAYERWQEGLSVKFTLPQELPLLRGLLILDNLAGHKTPSFVMDGARCDAFVYTTWW